MSFEFWFTHKSLPVFTSLLTKKKLSFSMDLTIQKHIICINLLCQQLNVIFINLSLLSLKKISYLLFLNNIILKLWKSKMHLYNVCYIPIARVPKVARWSNFNGTQKLKLSITNYMVFIKFWL